MKTKENMALHQGLVFFKIFLIFFAAMDLITKLGGDMNVYKVTDMLYTLVKIALLSASLLLHGKKSGVVMLAAYACTELLYSCLILYLMKDLPSFSSVQVWNTLTGSCVIFVPVMLYYRKRWSLLA